MRCTELVESGAEGPAAHCNLLINSGAHGRCFQIRTISGSVWGAGVVRFAQCTLLLGHRGEEKLEAGGRAPERPAPRSFLGGADLGIA